MTDLRYTVNVDSGSLMIMIPSGIISLPGSVMAPDTAGFTVQVDGDQVLSDVATTDKIRAVNGDYYYQWVNEVDVILENLILQGGKEYIVRIWLEANGKPITNGRTLCVTAPPSTEPVPTPVDPPVPDASSTDPAPSASVDPVPAPTTSVSVPAASTDTDTKDVSTLGRGKRRGPSRAWPPKR